MRSRRIVATTVLLCAIAFLYSCGPIPSIHPLFSFEEWVFEPEVLGTWVSFEADGDSAVLVFEQRDSRRYNLTVILSNEETPLNLEARLGQLSGQWFMDWLLDKDRYPFGEVLDGYWAIPTHTFWRTKLHGDSLTIAGLDYEWVKDMIDEGKADLPYFTLGGNSVVLTASTEQLQEFVSEHAGNEEAFPDPWVLHRQKPGAK